MLEVDIKCVFRQRDSIERIGLLHGFTNGRAYILVIMWDL